jgi:fructokinase
MVYTSSSNAVYVRTPSIRETFPVRKIEPVSTIGAGDNFNAGMVYGLFCNNLIINDLRNLSVRNWEMLVNYGVDFATEVCMSYDNYISPDFAGRLKS